MQQDDGSSQGSELIKSYPVADTTQADIDNRFSYHTPWPHQIVRYGLLRTAAKTLAFLILRHTPPSREQALALTRLEECVMQANAAIARYE